MKKKEKGQKNMCATKVILAADRESEQSIAVFGAGFVTQSHGVPCKQWCHPEAAPRQSGLVDSVERRLTKVHGRQSTVDC